MGFRDLARRWVHRPTAMERLVEHSLHNGVGLYRHVWQFTDASVDRMTLDSTATDVAGWIEQAMGQTRRPYGIDQMAVGLACAPAYGTPIASVSLGAFRPVDYYLEGGIRDQVEAFVRELPLSSVEQRPLRLAAALFSWGDLARATVFHD